MADQHEDPNEDDLKLHEWCTRLVEDGRSIRSVHEAQWWENIATMGGDLWAEFNIHERKLVEQPKDDHRVRLPINLAQPIVRTEYAKLVKNRPIVNCLAGGNDQKALKGAEVGDKILADYMEREFHLARVRRRVLWWTLITGFAGIFNDYDEQARGKQELLVAPDGTPITDLRIMDAVKKHYRQIKKAPKTVALHQGELKPTVLSPFQILYDFSKIYIEDGWWVIVSDAYDIDEAYMRWGVELEPNNKVQPGVLERRLLDRLDLSKKLSMKSPTAQNLVEVHRLFVKPGHRYFPDGAEIVFTDEELIKTTSFPFKHGELPVSTMGHIPAPYAQYAVSVVGSIKPPVLEVSRTTSQMIENRNLMANPPWLIPEQIKLKSAITNKPGMRLRYQHMPNVPPPGPVQMPELPQYVKDLLPILKENVLEISGQGETSQGRVPPGARSGVAIAYLQEEDDTRLGPTVQEFEEMIERFSWQALQTIAEKYDTPRTVQLYRKHGEPEVFDFIGSMLDGVVGVIVQAGSALPRSKAAKQQFILDLWDRKLEQDPRKVREMLELSEGEPDEWDIDIRQAERENQKLSQGQQVDVLEWYNHPAHHYVHRRFMKSPEFEALPEEAQKLFIAHDALHTAWESKQMQDVQQWQQQGVDPTQNGAGGANGVNAVPEGPFGGGETIGPDQGSNVQDYQPQ